MNIINCRAIARRITENVQQQITQTGIIPAIAVILVGQNPASVLYVSLKEKAARTVGMRCTRYNFSDTVSEKELLGCIDTLNNDRHIHAILIQLPLPQHLNTHTIVSAIHPAKDVDGYHTETITSFLEDATAQPPIMVSVIDAILKETEILPQQKHAVILSNNHIFADPIRVYLERREAIVDVFAPTPQLVPVQTRDADILISALGRPHWILSHDIKKNAVVIDIGITRCANGLTVGDINPANLELIDGYITPVPGGVGPLTIAYVLLNTLNFALVQKYAN